MDISGADTENDLRMQVALRLAGGLHLHAAPRDNGRLSITHPMLVSDILKEFGAHSVQRGMALLHDVIEDSAQILDSERLERKLYLALFDAHPPMTSMEKANLYSWAHEVSQGVKALTNDEFFYEDKRSWQTDHASRLNQSVPTIKVDDAVAAQLTERNRNVCTVKIIDQAASVIDDILYCDPRNAEAMRKKKGFAMKGLDVSRASRGDDPDNPYHEFYKRVFAYFMDIYEAAQAGDYVRTAHLQNAFDWKKLVAEAKAPVKRLPMKQERVVHYYSPAFPQLTKGLARVTISRESGNVVGFGVIVDANGPQSGVNKLARKVCDKIEERRFGRVQTLQISNPIRAAAASPTLNERGTEQHDNIQVRDYTVKPPVPLKKFVSMMNEIHALDRRFLLERLPHSDIKRDQSRGLLR